MLGLSGGIDSSLVACIAAEALGPGHVHAVAMPSRYSSDGSRTDAEDLAVNLGVDHRPIPIEAALRAFLDLLAPSFVGREPDLTEENLQSRIRGMLLMALSNKFGWLVLTTGNKSEMAVGYSTLYGDSAGGFAVIKDVPKLLVYGSAAYVNERAGHEVVPESVLTKPPSAELRPDQRDDQSLPPYEVLDPILEAYVEHDRTAAELIAARLRRGDRPSHHAAGRPRRVQAAPVPARRAGDAEGVRQGPPPADHQPLPRLSCCSAGPECLRSSPPSPLAVSASAVVPPRSSTPST